MTQRKSRPKTNRRIRTKAASTRKSDNETKAASDPEVSAARLVVGIGASVGGLEAFRTFFANMPSDSGMAFVLIQHLAPDHGSILTELIGHSTAMKVVEATDGALVVPNCVFVIPPNATLTMADGHLKVAKPAPARENRRPVDTFMFSLAEDQGENAVCVILSGSGSDGAQGLAAIKEHGGITLAQAQFDETAMSGMPSSAAATGLVDHVLPVESLPEKLLDYQRHLTDVRERKGSDGTREDARRHLDEVCALLDRGVGHDFSQYKEGTLVRRIQRRMQVRNFDEVAEYIAFLRKEPREVELLFRDLLIGVTHFFRDPDAFEALETKVIPELLKNRDAGDQVRVWVAGCATGEEVYSIAILLQEAAAKVSTVPKFVIFATDINDAAIAIARSGRYHKSRLDGLSSERIRQWFIEDEEYFCPIAEIRDMCVFSVHSLVKDPPFSRLSLISCRNLLIYMDTSAQDRLVPVFHYALRPGGYLFLGPSESVTRQGEFFAVLDKRHRLFQRNDSAVSTLPNFSLSEANSGSRGGAIATPSVTHSEAVFDRGARRAMEKYSPAYVVVDKQHQILRFSGQTGKYLEPSEGPPSFDLFSLIQSALRPAVRAALREAASSRRRVIHQKIAIEVDGKSQEINLIIEPILQASGAAQHYVVAFQDHAPADDLDGHTSTDGDNPTLRELQNELHTTRARLQAAIDEAERVNEELSTASEEYRSANEEMQSSNEELEASKEELQSLNEELQTLNSELSRKNETMAEVNSDLQNFLDSSRIPMLFLDTQLRVRNFTPTATEIFHLRDRDRGRPITDIANLLGYWALEDNVKECLRSLAASECETYIGQSDTTYMIRIRPYRAATGTIGGVVITFVDISERKRHEAAQAQLAAIIESSRDAVIGHTMDGTITSWNAGAEQMFGYTAKEAIGQPSHFLVPKGRPDEVPELLKKLGQGQRIEHYDTTRQTKDGRELDVSVAISPIRDANNHLVGASKVFRDVTERHRAERHRGLLTAELDHRVKNTLAAVQSIAMQTGQHATSIEEFRTAFDSRLMSLAQTHNLLTQSHWENVSLLQLATAELSPYGVDGQPSFTISRDDVSLTPKQALALGLVFHELATNAAKYGAFSVRQGRVDVSWGVVTSEDGLILELRWTESDGPRVEKPGARGFGSRLIERGLRTALDADVQLDFDPHGVRAVLRIPLEPEGA